MITSISLLSLALVASPITVTEVTASREAGRLVVDITGEAMIDPEVATAKVGSGTLYLYVRDTRVRADNRAWGEGESEIRAHRHRGRIELAVPLPDDGACRGPVEFEKAATGLRASVGCDGGVAAVKPAAKSEPAVRPAPAAKVAPAARVVEAKVVPEPPAPRSQKVEMPPSVPAAVEPAPAPVPVGSGRSQREEEQLKAMLALVDVPADVEAAGATKPQASTPPALVAVNIDSKPAKGTETARAEVPGSTPKAANNAEAVKTPAPATATLAEKPTPSGGSGGMILAVILMIGLAGSAYYFKRRRGTVSRFINIVETANLGPKRSLIVARIGDETMILGASEAGITLLKAHTETRAEAAAAAAPTTARTGDAMADAWFETPPDAIPDAEVSLDDVSSTDLTRDEFPMIPAQGGLLARLFKRARPANEADSDPLNFDTFLEDSIEDQELRRKLSMGMAGRVA